MKHVLNYQCLCFDITLWFQLRGLLSESEQFVGLVTLKAGNKHTSFC